MWKTWLSPGSTATLVVGYPSLDEGHRALFRLFERVYSAAYTHSVVAPLGCTPELAIRIEELCGVLEDHFRTEEALMEEHGYPDRLLHRAAHDAFREEMSFVRRTLARGALTPALGARIAGEAPGWVEAHIRTFDRPLGGYLGARQEGSSGTVVPHARRAARRWPAR